MNKSYLNAIKTIKSNLDSMDPSSGTLLGEISFSTGKREKVFDNKAGAMAILTGLCTFLDDSGPLVTECKITKAGLENGLMCILWQLVNNEPVEKLLENEKYFCEV